MPAFGALPMVALVNVLVGGIVAFVGSLELRRFGAEIYVSNLIGVMEVREMGPLMTAIVMSGRTGSAYAAEIATMQGTEEIDALRVIGIPIFDYLILPRLAALTAMMPLLYMYAAALGILGGFAVAVYLMNISVGGFITHLRGAVSRKRYSAGLGKSDRLWKLDCDCELSHRLESGPQRDGCRPCGHRRRRERHRGSDCDRRRVRCMCQRVRNLTNE